MDNEGLYIKDDHVKDYAYEAITNTKSAPTKEISERSTRLYEAMNVGAVHQQFEAIALVNLKESRIELIRYKDISMKHEIRAARISSYRIFHFTCKQ